MGSPTHRMTGTPEHNAWCGMRERCAGTNPAQYKCYGSRGIVVCPRWDSFEAFFTDMGHKPTPKHTLDRINNDGNYEPSNCRWATISEQQRNKRPYKNTASGITGVNKQYNHWVARIYVNNKQIFLGRTKDLEKARAMRKAGELKYW